MKNALFTGKPEPFGGLSNERELAKQCPPEFKKTNKWSDAAMRLFFSGGNIAHWKWKSEDPEERKKQKQCFTSVLGTFDLKHEDKEAVAGWMLSEMLSEVPSHIPAEAKR